MIDPPQPLRSLSRVLDSIPGAYLQEAAQAFSRAAASSGMRRDLSLSLADLPVRLSFAGHLAPSLILPTLSHLITPDAPSAPWKIHCWDDATTSSALPFPTEKMLYHQQRYCPPLLCDARFRTFHMGWVESFSWIDLAGEAYCCYPDAAALPMYEKAAPMRPIFNALLNRHGKQIVHAASVGYPHGTVLLAGPARSGKSTLAVQCLLQGMHFQSDDLCVLSEENQPHAWCLYHVAKLREDSVSRLTLDFELQSFVEGGEKKYYFHVREKFPDRLLPKAPVRALVIPRISGATTSRLLPASRLDAMKALIPWSVSEVPASDHLGEKIMLKAIRRLPAYHLELGSDFPHTFALLQALTHAV